MKWLRRLFGREQERLAVDAELARLEQRSDAAISRSERVIAEQKQLASAVRATVNALRKSQR